MTNKDKEQPIYSCIFMDLPICRRQDLSKKLAYPVCIACILGRIEKHLHSMRYPRQRNSYDNKKGNF
jgi:hypothetical protein